MIAWYRDSIKRYGAIEATKLFGRSYGSRAVSLAVNAVFSPRFACPCCGWEGRRFFEYIAYGFSGRSLECPGCISHGRHRALWLWLRNDFEIAEKKGIALVFAPEKALAPMWNSTALQIIRSDIESARGIDVYSDIQMLPLLDDSVDLVWCHHVLEQVPDDGAAMSEIYRVLRPESGNFVVSSGMSGDIGTYEYSDADMKQEGCKRIYGEDFVTRLENTGFEVNRIDYKLTTEDARRYGIDVEEKAYICGKPFS